jgi:DNA-binding transcriptional LysR family regulator
VDRSYGARVVQAVLEKQADFGIAQLPIQEKRLEVARIHSDEIRLIVPAGHALANNESVLATDVLDDPLLLPGAGKTRSRLNTWLEPVEESIRVSMEVDSTEMMKRFVMAGLGLAFLASSNFQEEVAAGRLAAVSLGPEPMIRRLGLIYRKDKALSKAAIGFIKAVLDQADGGSNDGDAAQTTGAARRSG